MEKLGVWKTKTQRKHLGKLFVNERIEEQNKSPKFLFSLIFPNPKTQNQFGSLKPKNTFENLEINSGETLFFLVKKSYQNPQRDGVFIGSPRN